MAIAVMAVAIVFETTVVSRYPAPSPNGPPHWRRPHDRPHSLLFSALPHSWHQPWFVPQCLHKYSGAIRGITRSVMPPPRLPQPPAVALTVPTMEDEKNCEHQTWHVTKVASERPTMMRPMMKAVAP